MLYNTDLTVTSHELLFLFLYEFLTIRETLAHAFTNLIVAEVAAVEYDRTELLHINTTVFSYDTLIDMSLHDLTHDTVTAEVITDAHHLALHREQVVVEYGSIHLVGLADSQAGTLHLVRHLLCRRDSNIIRLHHMTCIGDSQREALPLDDVVRSLVPNDVQCHFMVTYLCASCSVHSIRVTVLVIRSDNQHRLWEHEYLCTKTLLHNCHPFLFLLFPFC